ncbi:hypothetical protein [Heyndrickxia camelliae]|uniref:Uncharacterized protein n=1 Tax=Heyndrickxia camelliae TaxID=1707093 RepID=A0A2N3LG90_9BACI|nr:hypothetical protein [Heyndrickxia camelliae]PKR83533.1 hypothetical protein CWO92_18380 [Heyndrickxia camelliae]
MKVIINNQTNLVVEDENGNILFQWLPINHVGGIVSNINIKTTKQEDIAKIAKEISKKVEEEIRKSSSRSPNGITQTWI